MKKGSFFASRESSLFADKYIIIEEIRSDEPIRQEGLFAEQRRKLHSEGKLKHRQIPFPTLENDQEKLHSKEPINQPKK